MISYPFCGIKLASHQKGVPCSASDTRIRNSDDTRRAVTQHPDRFFPVAQVDPNRAMEGVRDLVRDYESYGVKAANCFPAGLIPQVDIGDKRF